MVRSFSVPENSEKNPPYVGLEEKLKPPDKVIVFPLPSKVLQVNAKGTCAPVRVILLITFRYLPLYDRPFLHAFPRAIKSASVSIWKGSPDVPAPFARAVLLKAIVVRVIGVIWLRAMTMPLFATF